MVDESSKKCSQILENVSISSFFKKKKKKKKVGTSKGFFYCRWKLSSWIKSPFSENKKVEPHHIYFFSILSLSHIVALYTKATEKVHHQLNQGRFLEIKSGLEKKKKAILKMSVLCRVIGWEGWVPKPNLSCIYIIICTRKHKPLCLSNVWIDTVS